MFNSPRKSTSLQIFEALQGRIHFTAEQKAAFNRLRLGYEGEMRFSELLNSRIRAQCIPIFDLGLKVGGSECQLDSLLIHQGSIFHIEIKNFQGDYYTENDLWYFKNKKEIQNPLNQLSRGRVLLKEFLMKHHVNLPIKSLIVFMNPEFHLYQAPLTIPAIFPSQLNRFIHQLENINSTPTPYHQKIAAILTDAHIEQSKHEQLPAYEYDQLRKAVLCEKCRGQMSYFSTTKLICSQCCVPIHTEEIVMQNLREFSLLFPDQLIKLNVIYDWCGGIMKERSLKRILQKEFTVISKGRQSHYQYKDELLDT